MCACEAKWLKALRHAISDALRAAGVVIGFDVAVPRSRLPALQRERIVSRIRDRGSLTRCVDLSNTIVVRETRSYAGQFRADVEGSPVRAKAAQAFITKLDKRYRSPSRSAAARTAAESSSSQAWG